MPFGKGAAHDQSVRFSDTLVSWRMLTATPMRSSRPRCAAPRCAAPAPPEGQCARRCTKRLATPVRFADTTVHPGVQLPHPRRGKCTALHEATCHPCPVCGHNRSPWCAAPRTPGGAMCTALHEATCHSCPVCGHKRLSTTAGEAADLNNALDRRAVFASEAALRVARVEQAVRQRQRRSQEELSAIGRERARDADARGLVHEVREPRAAPTAGGRGRARRSHRTRCRHHSTRADRRADRAHRTDRRARRT
jgi:hypothetical protein